MLVYSIFTVDLHGPVAHFDTAKGVLSAFFSELFLAAELDVFGLETQSPSTCR